MFITAIVGWCWFNSVINPKARADRALATIKKAKPITAP